MGTSSYFSPVVLATNLAKAFEEAGANPEEINKIYRNKKLIKKCLKLFRGTHELKQRIIDCDADPFCPKGWMVEDHCKGGQMEWCPDKIKLYLSEKQNGVGRIEGNKLRKELTGKPVLNANVLDYLLTHTELIPEGWKRMYIFFWGTIYSISDGNLVVRYLCWDGGEWDWSYSWLGGGFRGRSPAALLVS